MLTLLLWHRQHAHHKLEIPSLLPAQFGSLLCIGFEQSLHQLEAHIDLYAFFRSGVFLQLVVAVCHIDQVSQYCHPLEHNVVDILLVYVFGLYNL